MVVGDGIHFFICNLDEDQDKKINFENQITTSEENDKECIVQFSENDGGYIYNNISNEYIIFFLSRWDFNKFF